MRVAILIQSFWPVLGGAQRQVQSLAPLLERRGVQITVVTRRAPGTPLRERAPGLEILRVPVPRHEAAASIAYVAAGAAAVILCKPDVIHAHDLLSPSTIALVARRPTGAPVVAKILSTGAHGDLDRLLEKPFGRQRFRAAARHFSAFVCLSSEVEQQLLEHGVAADRLVRIPNGVDGERFRPGREGEREAVRRELGLAHDEFVVLYCGRFAKAKRVDLLLAAFRDVAGKLLLVGEGPEEPQVRALADDPQLRSRVQILEKVQDPAPLYRAADLYVSASDTEGMSGSVLEAMASELCVLAAPASGMSELLDNDRGVLLADRSAVALAALIGDLAENPAKRADIGRNAREFVNRLYSLDTTADRLVALYKSVDDRAARPSRVSRS